MSENQNGRGRWNNRFGGRWHSRGQSHGRGNWRGGSRGWRGGGTRYQGRGRAGASAHQDEPRQNEPWRPQNGVNISQQDDSSFVSGSSLPSQHSVAVKTFPLNDNIFHLRHYMNGVVGETRELLISAAKSFLQRSKEEPDAQNQSFLNDKSTAFTVRFKALVSDSVLNTEWPSLRQDLEDDAEMVLAVFSVAHHQSFPVVDNQEVIARARLEGHVPLTPIKNIRTSSFGKLVSFQATVVRISNVRPICTWLTFQCEKCSAMMSTEQPYGKYQQPTKCVSSNCRSKTFTPHRGHEQTVTIDFQTVRLQEILFCESGRVPRTIDVELTADLCDVVAPSDVVTMTGVVKAMPVTDQFGPQNGLFSLYVHALALTCSNKLKPSAGILSNKFTDLDNTAINEIHDLGESLFKLLVASLCPSIYGHEIVKAGLILGLFGGTAKHHGLNTHIPVRGDPHILVVGDPGLGKSQMLLACANVAPRGVFVTATGVTTSGLTVTLTKEAGNEFVLEAGALVLADQGCCCIDEFDKMSSQHNALLEAMEQQSVSIAKSGLVCSLPARTAVLAAANPIGGHYNKSKTVSENIKMNPALLSRFDLVFVLVDRPNEELDALLSDHIMNMHTNKGSSSISQRLPFINSHPSGGTDSLKERLRLLPGEEPDLIPHELISKYIAYARQYVHPKLSPEACKVIQDFYLKLRQKHQNSDSTPITTRQLESLIRLTEARAKLQLREEASKHDAEEVVEIMRDTMIDVFHDGLGHLDFSRSANGSGMSSRGMSKKFLAALERASRMQQRNVFFVNELKQILISTGGSVSNFFDFIDSLNNQGLLLKKGPKQYQLQTVEV